MPAKGNKVLILDIEVDSEAGFPDIQKANSAITAISYIDRTTGERTVLVLDIDGALQNTERENVRIYPFLSEEELLLHFMDEYEIISPSIITGWNSDGFDVPYIYNRLKLLFGKRISNRLSPIGIVSYSNTLEKYRIAGVSSLDYMQMYKTFTYSEQPSYRLDAIGRLEVGMGKVEYEGSLDELFKSNIEKFIEYSLTDVLIIEKLDNKLKMIELVQNICSIGHVPYENFNHSSRYLEGTILTYLHRKGIISPDKPAGGREKMDELKESGIKGFIGAYVKDPIPGKYDWVYSLDLQSLYPSIIMSLNISPEAKIGRVKNWNSEEYLTNKLDSIKVSGTNDADRIFTRDEFKEFLSKTKFGISSNGVLYRDKEDKLGIIPEILDVWFNDRLKYKNLMKKYTREGNEELANFYDKRQHIQKIFLNAMYGCLGLPVFRFYDVDNAEAVTTSGQDVIKNSAKYLNTQYIKLLGEDKDYILYVDTDSLYASAKSLDSNVDKAETIKWAREFESRLNKFYDNFALMFFNLSKHRLLIKGESVARRAFWLAKKRYAMHKVFDLETNKDMDKLHIKGLDVVRSSYPKAFRKFMSEILMDILKDVSKDEIDDKILKFKEHIKTLDIAEVTRNTTANNISKYDQSTKRNKRALGQFALGTPVHVKAAIVYNRLLDHFNITKSSPIGDGDKVKWAYLKNNSLTVSECAFKGYNDPIQIIKFIRENIDHNKIFDSEMSGKLEDFYSALGWGKISTEVNQNAKKWFQ